MHNWRVQIPAVHQTQKSSRLRSIRLWLLYMKPVEVMRLYLTFVWPWWEVWSHLNSQKRKNGECRKCMEFFSYCSLHIYPKIHVLAQLLDPTRMTPMTQWPTCNMVYRFESNSMKIRVWTTSPLSGNCIHLKRWEKVVNFIFLFLPMRFGNSVRTSVGFTIAIIG